LTDKTLKIAGIVLGLAAFLAAGILIFGLYAGDGNLTGSSPQGTVSPGSETADTSRFPATVSGLALAGADSGPQAIAMISQLHGTDIQIKQGYIINYAGDRGQVTVWISESGSEDEAKQLFDIMDQKIIAAQQPSGQSQGPPFTDRRTMEKNGVDVAAVKGMGMENYYYWIGSKVYWIAAEGVDPVKALEEIMEAF